MDYQQGPSVQHRKLYSMSCGSLDEWVVWGKTDTCIYIWVSLFAAHLKLSQHC